MSMEYLQEVLLIEVQSADITIINGDLFQRVATVVHLKKCAFKKPNRIPVTYDQKPFSLHGRMDLDTANFWW